MPNPYTRAQDPTTAPALLEDLYKKNRQDRHLVEMILQNPNTPLSVLSNIADDDWTITALLQNPVLPILLLENPHVLQKFSAYAQSKIAKLSDDPSILMALAQFYLAADETTRAQYEAYIDEYTDKGTPEYLKRAEQAGLYDLDQLPLEVTHPCEALSLSLLENSHTPAHLLLPLLQNSENAVRMHIAIQLPDDLKNQRARWQCLFAYLLTDAKNIARLTQLAFWDAQVPIPPIAALVEQYLLQPMQAPSVKLDHPTILQLLDMGISARRMVAHWIDVTDIEHQAAYQNIYQTLLQDPQITIQRACLENLSLPVEILEKHIETWSKDDNFDLLSAAMLCSRVPAQIVQDVAQKYLTASSPANTDLVRALAKNQHTPFALLTQFCLPQRYHTWSYDDVGAVLYGLAKHAQADEISLFFLAIHNYDKLTETVYPAALRHPNLSSQVRDAITRFDETQDARAARASGINPLTEEQWNLLWHMTEQYAQRYDIKMLDAPMHVIFAQHPHVPLRFLLRYLQQDEAYGINTELLQVAIQSRKNDVTTLQKYVGHYAEEARLAVANHPNADAEILSLLIEDSSHRIRNAVLRHQNMDSNLIKRAWEILQQPVWPRTLWGADYAAMMRLLQNPWVTAEILRQSVQSPQEFVRKYIAKHENTPLDILQELLTDSFASVRTACLDNKNIPLSCIEILCEDPLESIQVLAAQALRRHQPTTHNTDSV